MCRRGTLLFGLISLLWASGAEATCSGSGTTWNCGAGTTSAQISMALSSAADGATLTFAAGSYSWNSFVSFDNTKGVTLICATAGSCNVSASGTVLGMNGNLSGTNGKLYRISGFNFTQTASAYGVIWFYGSGTMQQVRVDHNTFNLPNAGVGVFFGDVDNAPQFYGVIDHNAFTSSGSIGAFQYIGSQPTAIIPSPPGTANNLFFEDNTITITTMDNAGFGCMDIQGGQGVVYRHNTSLNCLIASHGVTHSGGPPNFELYNPASRSVQMADVK